MIIFDKNNDNDNRCIKDNNNDNNSNRIITMDWAYALCNRTLPDCILAIFYPPLKYILGCFWWFCRLRREIFISQNWLKG